jgi:hypothetical protein
MSTTDYTTYDDDAAHGKQAPSIDSLKFVRGDKVNFENGKTYVLIFFARFDKGKFVMKLIFALLTICWERSK